MPRYKDKQLRSNQPWSNWLFPDYEYNAVNEEVINDIEKNTAPSLDANNPLKPALNYYENIKKEELKNDASALAVFNNKTENEKLVEFKQWLIGHQSSTPKTKSIEEEYINSFRLVSLVLEHVTASLMKSLAAYLAENKRIKLWDKNNTTKEAQKKDPNSQFWLDVIEAWRAFHIARLAIVRSFGITRNQLDPWDPTNEDLVIDYDDKEHVTETIFIGASLSYICVFLLVAYQYNKNYSKLTELEKARMQFEMLDAIVWFLINVLRLNGTGALELSTNNDAEGTIDLGITSNINMSLLLFGYLFDLVNQLIYDLRKLYSLNLEIENIEARKNSPNPLQNLANQTLLAEKIKERDEFIRRSVITNVVYALGLSSGAICNLIGATKGIMFASTPIGVIIIFLSTFINQSKNWYVAVQEYKDIKLKCEKKHTALSGLIDVLDVLDKIKNKKPINKDGINQILIKNGLCPIDNDKFTHDGIRNYRLEQYAGLATEMRVANNKVILYSGWFALVLSSMLTLAFASTLVGLAVFLFGGLIYCGLKHTGLVPISAPSGTPSTSAMFLTYAKNPAKIITLPTSETPNSAPGTPPSDTDKNRIEEDALTLARMNQSGHYIHLL